MPVQPDLPSVSVILAVLNEIDFIDRVISDLLGQDYTGPLEVIVADGGSTDGTAEKLKVWMAKDSRLQVISNPERRQAYGLNLAAVRARGEILVRADGHTTFSSNYVRASVAVLGETGGAVGGRMYPVGRTRFGRAVAAAMKSPLTMGPGRFHHSEIREEVDTVYLGAMRREQFLALGGFRPFPSGTSEDADFYYRWRQGGGKVFVDPTIVSSYSPRDRPTDLWRQYFRYGLGKAEMLWVNRRLPSLRPLAPLALVLGFLAMGVVGVAAGVWWPAIAMLAVWILLLGWVAIRADEPALCVFLAAAIMHSGYGVGELWGLVRGPGSVVGLREVSSERRFAWLRFLFGGVIWIALIAAVAANWDEVRSGMTDSGIWFLVAVLLMMVGQLGGAAGWATLQQSNLRKRSIVGYLASQPAKYLPVGGLFQAAGQIGLTAEPGSGRKGVGLAFLVHAGVQVGAMSLVALLLFLEPDTQSWILVLVVVVAIASVVSLRSPVVEWFVGRVRIRIRRLDGDMHIPETAALWRSLAWTLVPAAAAGAAFAALLGLWDNPVAFLAAMGAFAVAWVVGFLVFPLPSGLGARELTLIAFLPGLEAPEVFGVSLVHRFAALLAEVLLLLVVSKSAFFEKSN